MTLSFPKYKAAGSNTNFIVNVVIFLFINDLDEKELNMLEVTALECTVCLGRI